MESLGKAFDFPTNQGENDFSGDGFPVFLHRFRNLLHPCRNLLRLLERGESRLGKVEDGGRIINGRSPFDCDDLAPDKGEGKEEREKNLFHASP